MYRWIWLKPASAGATVSCTLPASPSVDDLLDHPALRFGRAGRDHDQHRGEGDDDGQRKDLDGQRRPELGEGGPGLAACRARAPAGSGCRRPAPAMTATTATFTSSSRP